MVQLITFRRGPADQRIRQLLSTKWNAEFGTTEYCCRVFSGALTEQAYEGILVGQCDFCLGAEGIVQRDSHAASRERTSS